MNPSMRLQDEAAQGYVRLPGRDASPAVTPASDAAGATLVVRGIGSAAVRLGWDDLQALPRRQVGPLPIVCYTGRPVRPERIYDGWLLCSILERCGLTKVERMRMKQSLVLCYAEDGYRSIFTWHELFNSPVGLQALVAPEPGGRLTLVSGADLRAGPRNLQRMTSVQWLELP